MFYKSKVNEHLDLETDNKAGDTKLSMSNSPASNRDETNFIKSQIRKWSNSDDSDINKISNILEEPDSDVDLQGDDSLDDEISNIIERLRINNHDINSLSMEEKKKIQTTLNAKKLIYNAKIMNEYKQYKPWYHGGDHPLLGLLSYLESPPNRWLEPCREFFRSLKQKFRQGRFMRSYPKMNESIPFSLFSIIISYSLLSYLYQYDMYIDDKNEIIRYVSTLSGICDKSFQPRSVHEVIEHISSKISFVPGIQSFNPTRLSNILTDIDGILHQREYISLCVLDLWMISQQIFPSSMEQHINNYGASSDAVDSKKPTERLYRSDILRRLVEYAKVYSSPITAQEKQNHYYLFSRKIYFYLLVLQDFEADSTLVSLDRYENCMKELLADIQVYLSTFLH